MKRALVVPAALAISLVAATAPAQTPAETHFAPYGVNVTTGQAELAAYQIEVTTDGAGTKIVGIEGGEHPAFHDPPYYDPAALQSGRIVLGAFSTASDLPRGTTRVATLHLRQRGHTPPHIQARIIIAATRGGKKIPATVSVEPLRGDRGI